MKHENDFSVLRIIQRRYLSLYTFFFLFISISFQATSQECSISDVSASVMNCQNGEFFVLINFNFDNTSDSFHVNGNGMMYGDFSYDNTPITLGPFEENAIAYEFVVIDNGNMNCMDFVDLGVVLCDSSAVCEIGEINVEFDECTSDSTYRITIDFDHANTQNVAFDLWANGGFFGFYSYNDLPLTIDNFPLASGMVNGLLVCDNDNANCCSDVSWPTPNCDNNTDCSISDLVVEIFDCEAGEFFVDIDFNSNSTSDSFEIRGNGISYGYFHYSDAPITLGPLSANSTNYEFIIIDAVIPGCAEDVGVGVVMCDSSEVCQIFDIVTEEFDCQNGEFYIDIDFEYLHVGDSFKLAGNGNQYGHYNYQDLPITLGPLSLNMIFDELVVMDLIFPNCMAAVEVEVDCGQDCELSELEVLVADLVSDSTFDLTFNFDFNNVSDSFNVFSGNVFVETFAYADLPVTILEFPSRNLPDELLRICDGDDMDCCVVIEFLVNDGDDCSMSEVTSEVVECAGDTVYAFVDFNVADGSSAGFEILGNGEHYGFFQCDNLPVLISFIYQEGDFVDLIIRDLANPTCLGYTYINDVDCSPACEFLDLTTTFEGCSSDSTYHFLLNMNPVNTNGLGFDLWANGDFFGYYEYGNLPVFVEHFPSTGNQVDEIRICDNDNPNCCVELIMPVPNCISGVENIDEVKGLKVLSSIGRWQIEVSEPGLMTIYDMSGRTVRSPFEVDRTAVINNLVSGVYLITWTGSWGVVSKSSVFIE